MFARKAHPAAAEPAAVTGVLNGRPFQSLEDADARFGGKLELLVAGQYMWPPFEHVAAIQAEAPRRLRDLLWVPAQLRTGPAFQGRELGEVLLPALYPLSWRHPDDAVRLGRATVYAEQGDGTVAGPGLRRPAARRAAAEPNLTPIGRRCATAGLRLLARKCSYISSSLIRARFAGEKCGLKGTGGSPGLLYRFRSAKVGLVARAIGG